MKRFLNLLFSKLAFGLLFTFIQFSWVVVMLYVATVWTEVINIGFHILSVIVALYVIRKTPKPYFKISWIFLILFFPVFGCPCYYVYGRNGVSKNKQLQMRSVLSQSKEYRQEDTELKELMHTMSTTAWMQSKYITDFAGYPLCPEHESEYFSSGESVFPRILEDIDRAKKYIFLEFFILEPGVMFDTVVDHLEKKAKEGVHVRLIYDDVGCNQTLPRKYYRKLQAKGIHCACFNPLSPLLSTFMNNRDHRKILSIDGMIAYTGGINLADEYINEIKRFGYWKDAAIRVTGEAAWSFTVMFLEMWQYIVKGSAEYERFIPDKKEYQELSPHTGGFLQPFCDSPLEHEDVGENVYLNMIYQANQYVYIFTPYLIISWEMIKALVNAAKCGVDVRIVTPGIPDKKTVYWLTQSNYEVLIRGGVKIYRFTPGFIHSKCLVSDDKYAVVGSINFDFRSFYLHFECGVFLSQAKAVMSVKEDALKTFEESELVSIEDCEERGFIRQMLLSILQLFSPLL